MEDYISAHFQQVALFFYDYSLIPALEDMSGTVMPAIKCLRINSV